MTVFDLTIAADRLAPLPLNWTVEADAAQRATVRDIAGILDCSMLKAAATFRPVKRGTGGFCIPLEIHLRADIVQACGVTLDPVPCKTKSCELTGCIFSCGVSSRST